MLDDKTTYFSDMDVPAVVEEPRKPEIRVVDADDHYGKFIIEPLEPGFATTLGNPMRRVLLTAIPGTAITWVKIDGSLHEYSTIPHMKEDISEFLLNIKSIRIRSLAERPGKLRLETNKEGDILASDIDVPADFEILNPDLHLASLDSKDANISVEFNVDQGKGYVTAGSSEGLPIGVLLVDSIFSTDRKSVV